VTSASAGQEASAILSIAQRFSQMLCAFDQPKRAGILRAKGDDHVV
jgi:hypothetical protein